MIGRLVSRVGLGLVLAVFVASATQGCGSGDESDESGGSGGDASGSGGKAGGSGGKAGGSGGKAGGSGGGIGSGVGGSLLGQGGEGGEAVTECNDGIDNDGDGLTDYTYDPGCYGPWDGTERSGTRAEENGFTTFEFGDDSVVVYVSAEGDDDDDGATPETAVRTLARASQLVRDGEHDFMLLRRGDTWRDETLGRFKSGRDAEHPLVIGSYGEELELPRVEIAENFINHDGQNRSFVALLDLHLVNYAKDPSDPEFDGASDSILRYIGSGSNLLIEGCHLEYVEVILQSLGEGTLSDVEVRANVIEKAYHIDTCSPGNPDGNSAYRPSGIYASHVDGLLIEGNVLDHNGWNEDVESACATIYNHNVYLNANDLVIRDNVFSRASSIHIKLRSDESRDMTGIRISGNYFVEGEIGVSIGGNTEEADRFVDSEITDNVFSDIGRSQPTTRTLAWGVDVQDNDGALVSGNYFLNQRTAGVNNSYALNIAGDTMHDLRVSDNLFYRIQNRALVAQVASGHETIEVSNNSFIDPDQGSRLVTQQGSFAAYSYSNNRYYSSANAGSWFGTQGGNVNLDGWVDASGETGAEGLSAPPDFADPERSIESYAASLNIGDSLEDYLEEARLQTRLRFYPELSAPAINDYIRAGFAE